VITGFVHGVEHCPTPYQILVPEKIDTDSHDTPAENWYRFSVPVSGACVIGRTSGGQTCELILIKFGTQEQILVLNDSHVTKYKKLKFKMVDGRHIENFWP